MMDSGATGRLEVTIFFNQKTATKDGKGVMIHSKANGQGYPYQDWKSFEDRLKAAYDANAKKQ